MNDDPLCLYKFRKVDKWLIESLVGQSLYFARPNMLNDPFDCRIDIQKSFERAASCAAGNRKSFLAAISSNQEFFRLWRSTFETIGVCCFSRTMEQTLLWSHYADQHKGVCLEWQIQRSWLSEHISDLTLAEKLYYLDDPLVPWLLKKAPLDHEMLLLPLIHRYLRTKSTAWKYEQEARIISGQHGPFKIGRPGFVLKEICFGMRTPNTDAELVTKLAENYGGCTSFSKIVSDGTEFGFKKTPFVRRSLGFARRTPPALNGGFVELASCFIRGAWMIAVRRSHSAQAGHRREDGPPSPQGYLHSGCVTGNPDVSGATVIAPWLSRLARRRPPSVQRNHAASAVLRFSGSADVRGSLDPRAALRRPR